MAASLSCTFTSSKILPLIAENDIDIFAMDISDLTDFSAKTIEDFKTWSDDALRQFLVLRGRSASGSSHACEL